MKKIKKFAVSSQNEGTNNEPIEKGSFENPYTTEEYEQLHDQNQWAGGYVEGVGMISGDNQDEVITGNYYAYGYTMIPDYGISSGIRVKFSTVESQGYLQISCSILLGNNNFQYTGYGVLKVGGKEKLQKTMSISHSVIVPEGESYLGDVEFDLAKYHGHVEVEACVIGTICTEYGNQSVRASQIVYSKNL